MHKRNCEIHQCPLTGRAICPVEWIEDRMGDQPVKDIIPPNEDGFFTLVFENGRVLKNAYLSALKGQDPQAIMNLLTGCILRTVEYQPGPMDRPGVCDVTLEHVRIPNATTTLTVDLDSVFLMITDEQVDTECPD